jgi:hypothetical protein
LTNHEFSRDLYGTADLDANKVITVEEEGWFDSDDVQAEIEEVGDVL